MGKDPRLFPHCVPGFSITPALRAHWEKHQDGETEAQEPRVSWHSGTRPQRPSAAQHSTHTPPGSTPTFISNPSP